MADQPRFIFSANTNKGERTQLLRPRMLDEYVFPNVGLIMYGFFWLKFGLWLHSEGLDPDEQSELLLWTEYPDGRIEFRESILYYSILLVYVDADTSNIPGKRITNGWLFAKQPSGTDQYDRIVEELEMLVKNPNALSGTELVEAVIAPWFRTRCQELDVDFPARLEDHLAGALHQEYPDERGAMERAVEAFVTSIGEVCHEHPTLYQNYNTAPINEPFDLTAMLWATEAPAWETLANRDVELTRADVDALFDILVTFSQGVRMLHSFCFIAYFGPYNSGESQLRDVYDICRERGSKVIETAEQQFGQEFNEEVVADIVTTSFFYEVNYVLAEAETIARQLLKEREGHIRLTEVARFLDGRRDDLPVARLERFVDDPGSVTEHLPTLTEQYDDVGENDIVAFLNCLQEAVERGEGPAELLVTLLIHEGTLSVFDKQNKIYQIERPPETPSPASFYGTGSIRDYAVELLDAANP